MAEEKKEVVEETTDQTVEEVVEEKIDESKFSSAGDDSVIKIDLDKTAEIKNNENVEEPTVEEISDKVEDVEKVVEQTQVLEEVTEDQVSEVEDAIEEVVAEAEATGKPLPENIQKLVEFMEETGGDLKDYVNLNRDISKMDDSDILDEYYRDTKSHLTAEERNFLLEDSFGFNEDEDDAIDIRKKKIALKEQVAKAKSHLDGQKSKYYEEIKAGSRLTPEAKKAIDFFNRYNKDQEKQNKLSESSKRTFLNKTNKLFNDKFKGFEYNVGEKKYRFNVKDVNEVKTTQSDINNFVNKFVGEDNATIEDAEGYHKSLFTGMNADAIAKHFYEQGKADAVKGQIAKDKNINLNPRQTHGEVSVDGFKVKVLGESSSQMKNRSFKIKKKR
jgi:G:T/U-mismatch repair DNA glycosylase